MAIAQIGEQRYSVYSILNRIHNQANIDKTVTIASNTHSARFKPQLRFFLSPYLLPKRACIVNYLPNQLSTR